MPRRRRKDERRGGSIPNATPPEYGQHPRGGRVSQRRARSGARAPRVPPDAAGRGRFRSVSVLVRPRSGRSSCRADRRPASPSRRPLRREKKAKRHHAVLRHEAVVHGLHVVLHFVGPGELLAADRTREHLSLVALVIEERVPLEAVLVLEGLLDVELRALGALVHALGDRRVAKEIQAADRHLGQLFSGILGVGRGATSHAPLGHLAARRCGHRADLMGARRRRVGRWRWAAAAATAAAVLRVVPAGGRGRRRASRGRGGRGRPGTGRWVGAGGRCQGRGGAGRS